MLLAPDGAVAEFVEEAAAELSLDGIIATSYLSFRMLPERPDATRLGYYIQDLETSFFEEGTSDYAVALDSYLSGRKVRSFTKTKWNADAVAAIGASLPIVVGPSVDAERFCPGSDDGLDPGSPVRVVAMVRPSTPRRNPAMTLAILRALRDQYGDRLSVCCFGASVRELETLAVPLDGITCLGHLPPERVAAALARTDVFLDFSVWQAMGLTALEAMASGAAVVVPERGGSREICEDRRSGIVVDTSDLGACLGAAKLLIDDAELRLKIRHGGIRAAAQHLPEGPALRLLRALLGP